MSNTLFVSTNQAISEIKNCMAAGLVPLLKGSPGCGKSDIMRSIAAEYNLKLIDVRLAQIDEVELNGFPDLSGDKATYKPFDIFPIEGDELPINSATGKPYNGWLIFFDELTSADKSTQGAA